MGNLQNVPNWNSTDRCCTGIGTVLVVVYRNLYTFVSKDTDDAEVVTPSWHGSDAAAPEQLTNQWLYICGGWSRSRTQATSPRVTTISSPAWVDLLWSPRRCGCAPTSVQGNTQKYVLTSWSRMTANITRKDPDCREAEKSRQRLSCVPYELFFCNVDSSVSSVTFTLAWRRRTRDLSLRCKAAVTKLRGSWCYYLTPGFCLRDALMLNNRLLLGPYCFGLLDVRWSHNKQ